MDGVYKDPWFNLILRRHACGVSAWRSQQSSSHTKSPTRLIQLVANKLQVTSPQLITVSAIITERKQSGMLLHIISRASEILVYPFHIILGAYNNLQLVERICCFFSAAGLAVPWWRSYYINNQSWNRQHVRYSSPQTCSLSVYNLGVQGLTDLHV